ncbi:hypothetical protein F1880_001534, partial [Penicillium rolfsii]
DVLLRHEKTCKQNDNRPLGPVKRGRKRKACDTCALGRVACDGDSPCEACLLKGLDCSHSCAQQVQAIGPGTEDQETSKSHPQSLSTNKPCAETRQSSQRRLSISFLLNCPHHFHRLLAEQHEDEVVGPTIPSGQFTETWPFLFHAFIDPSALDTTSLNSGMSYGLQDYPSLSRTSEGLFRCLDQAPPTCARDIGSYRMTARAFVSEANIMRFVDAFFQYAYSSNPFIHKASFNVNTASRYLVLAILCYGLTYASRENTSAYNESFNVVEFLIFEGSEFQQLLRQKEHLVISQEIIQLIQAAILIIELQGSRSDVETKRRIRVQRLPTLIFVIRLLNLTKMVNDIVLNGQIATLEEWLNKETLVRLVAWVFLLDAHCVIFYHSPPQLRLFEAEFGLPMHEAIFDAMNISEASDVTATKSSQAASLTLRSVVQRLMEDMPIDLEREQLQIDSLFALFLILSALHCVLFDLQALASIMNTPDALRPVERALDRWKLIWDSKCMEYQLSSMGLSGFMVHALEFWWLAKKLVKEPQKFRMRDEVAADSTEAFHEMVKSLKAAQAD